MPLLIVVSLWFFHRSRDVPIPTVPDRQLGINSKDFYQQTVRSVPQFVKQGGDVFDWIARVVEDGSRWRCGITP
jgi:hypothetical protein